jgi:hypothetical protein
VSLCVLLKLRVFGLDLLKDGNVGIGVFPERKEITVGDLRFGGVALHCVGAGETESYGPDAWLLSRGAGVAQEDYVGDDVEASNA